jgi:hypothetical protein
MVFRLAMIIGGGWLAWWGFGEFRLNLLTKSEPAAVTCAKLIETAGRDNAHVRVTDFIPCGAYIYKEFRKESERGTLLEQGWQFAYVPVMPLDFGSSLGAVFAAANERSITDKPPVLVKIPGPVDEAAVERFMETETFEGVVINSLDPIPKDAQDILRQAYARIDIDQCVIVELGRKPKSPWLGVGAMAGGLLLSLTGVALLIPRRAKSAAAAEPEQDENPEPTASAQPPADKRKDGLVPFDPRRGL